MILARVRRSVRERELLHAGQGVLVGCSGGPDSVALVQVLARLADELGVHASAITRARQRLDQRVLEDERLERWMRRLADLLPSS